MESVSWIVSGVGVKERRRSPVKCSAVKSKEVAAIPPITGTNELVGMPGVIWKPLVEVMRSFMISELKSMGIALNEVREDYYERYREAVMEGAAELEDPEITYPDYYRVQFHLYEKGNFDELHAAELHGTTRAVGARYYKAEIAEGMGLEEAILTFRNSYLDKVKSFHTGKAETILDVGGSAGYSAEFLGMKFPDAHISVIDLSPLFLSFGRVRLQGKDIAERIDWVHANGENLESKYAENSVDLVSLSLVVHELPRSAIIKIIESAFKVLRPGGTFSLTDHDPAADSEIPKLVLMIHHMTEPHKRDSAATDFGAEMTTIGFEEVSESKINKRHLILTGRKPTAA